MGRQAEIQPVLHHHHVGGMLAQGPGLLFADDLHPRQWCAKPDIALHLGCRGWRFGRRAVVHQVTAKEAPQFVFEHPALFIQQKLPEGTGQPLAGRADQCQPVRIRLSERFIGHCILQLAKNSSVCNPRSNHGRYPAASHPTSTAPKMR
ncbi:hypothetical protein D3C78_1222860 [compost metagenome]